MPTVVLRQDNTDREIELPRVSHDEFIEFCERNDKLRVERSAEGKLQFMPSDFLTDFINMQIAFLIHQWNETQSPKGLVFGASAGFTLANGAIRSPDVSWMSRRQYEQLSPTDRPFPHVCPELVIEVMSPSNSLASTQSKLTEYVENGARLGLLFDLARKSVSLYRPQAEPVLIEQPITLSCEPELPGCVLNLERIFE